MVKEYIKDNKKVKMCDSNIAKMNIFEFMYYYRYRMRDNIIDSIKEFLECWVSLVNILSIIILPILYPIVALHNIHRAKKEVMRQQKNLKNKTCFKDEYDINYIPQSMMVRDNEED